MYMCWSSMHRDLGHRPLRRDVAVEDLQVSCLLDRRLHREDDLLAICEAGERDVSQ